DRAGRVAVLQLGPQPHRRRVRGDRGREPGKTHQRGLPARVEQRLVTHTHSRAGVAQARIGRAGRDLTAAGAAADGAPPATAGSTVTVSPSESLVSSPLRNRTSSSLT